MLIDDISFVINGINRLIHKLSLLIRGIHRLFNELNRIFHGSVLGALAGLVVGNANAHQDRLRDHLGRVQGLQSVCSGGGPLSHIAT